MEHSDYKVEPCTLSPADWTAIGAIPRPAFILRIHVEREREVVTAKPVKQRDLEMSQGLRALIGEVYGADDKPLVGARVLAPAFDRSAKTDARGKFRISGLPEAAEIDLLITAKGKNEERTLRIRQKPTQKPVRLNFPKE